MIGKRRYGKVLRATQGACGCSFARYTLVKFDHRSHAARSTIVEIQCPTCRRATTLDRTIVRSA